MMLLSFFWLAQWCCHSGRPNAVAWGGFAAALVSTRCPRPCRSTRRNERRNGGHPHLKHKYKLTAHGKWQLTNDPGANIFVQVHWLPGITVLWPCCPYLIHTIDNNAEHIVQHNDVEENNVEDDDAENNIAENNHAEDNEMEGNGRNEQRDKR